MHSIVITTGGTGQIVCGKWFDILLYQYKYSAHSKRSGVT